MGHLNMHTHTHTLSLSLSLSPSVQDHFSLSQHLWHARYERDFMKSWVTLAAKFGFPAISFGMGDTTVLPRFAKEPQVCATAPCSQAERAHGMRVPVTHSKSTLRLLSDNRASSPRAA